MSDCEGCRYENSTDIREHLSVCNYCQRAYAGADRDYHDDRYEKRVTNADRIRAMDDEELADYLYKMTLASLTVVEVDSREIAIPKLLKWLQSEAE